MSNELREALADYAHRAWSGGMRHLFGRCQEGENGTLVIPKFFVDRYRSLYTTKYADLKKSEKETSRYEADLMLKIMKEYDAL